MSKTKAISLCISITLIFITFLVRARANQQDEQSISGIPIKVSSEHQTLGTRFITIVMPRQYYSKENLERIWQYYCEKYPDKKDKLDVRVFTDSKGKGPGSSSERGYDAQFLRQGEGLVAGGGDNEFYTYRPNLDKPDERKDVQLKGRYPFLVDSYSGTPDDDFVLAAKKGDIPKLEAHFKQAIDVNTRDEKGRTALMAACTGGHIEIVKMLLARGADVNAKDKEGDTALNEAVSANGKNLDERGDWRWGHPGIVKLLLESGADVNAQKEGWTPLLSAVSHGSNDIVTMLLERGADLSVRTDTGMSALARAIYDGKGETAKLLLERGAEINTRDKEGNTPLIRAVTGKPEVVRLLLSKGASVNERNKYGVTALMKAYWQENVQALLDNGADVNAKDNSGSTALVHAIVNYNAEKVQVLLERGADVNSKNNKGETALAIAKTYSNSKAIVELLLKYGAKEQ